MGRSMVLGALLALVVVAPAPAATLRLRDAGPTTSWLHADSASVVAWDTPSGLVRVVTAHGRQADLGRPCEGGNLEAAGGRAVLLRCPGGGGPLGDQGRFALRRIDGAGPFFFLGPPMGAGAEEWDPYAMGRRWIAGGYDGYHVSITLYRRRDRPTLVSGAQDPIGARGVIDLDRPGLGRPLCKGVRRTPSEDSYDIVDSWQRMDYQSPWAWDGGPLRRCGSGKRRAMPPGATGIRLGGGLVTWYEPASDGGYRLAVLQPDGRAKRYAIPGREPIQQLERAGRTVAVLRGSLGPPVVASVQLATIPRR